MIASPEKNKERYWKYLVESCPKTCRLVLESYSLPSNGALKFDPGGVLSCVIYGNRCSRRGVERPRVCLHLDGSSRCDTERVRRKSLQACARCITLAAHILKICRRPGQNYEPNGARNAHSLHNEGNSICEGKLRPTIVGTRLLSYAPLNIPLTT